MPLFLPTLIFAITLSLLPHTESAEPDENEIQKHMADQEERRARRRRMNTIPELEEVEAETTESNRSSSRRGSESSSGFKMDGPVSLPLTI